MACVNPDGTLSVTAKSILSALSNPLTIQDLAAETRQPVFVIRSALRELGNAGFVEPQDEKFILSAQGKEVLGK